MSERDISEAPRVRREAFLVGGLVATNEPQSPKVVISVRDLANIVEFEIGNYKDFYNGVRSLGLGIVGVKFTSSGEELEGLFPADWRTFEFKEGWVGFGAADKFSMASHGALNQDKMYLWDVCSRVYGQLRVCEFEIKVLAENYQKLLKSTCIKNVLDEQNFDNQWNEQILIRTQSTLHSLAELRDYVCEFAGHVLGGLTVEENTKTASRFLKRFKGNVQNDQHLEKLIDELKSESRGSLRELGEYRNFITHSAPLNFAGYRAFACKSLHSIGDLKVPIVSSHLPSDIFELVRSRSKFSIPESKADFLLEKQKLVSQAPSGELDCLSYLHSQFIKIASLAAKMLAGSDLCLERLSLGAEDALGPIEVSHLRPI